MYRTTELQYIAIILKLGKAWLPHSLTLLGMKRTDENVVGLKIKLVIIIQGHKKRVPDCYFLITQEIN